MYYIVHIFIKKKKMVEWFNFVLKIRVELFTNVLSNFSNFIFYSETISVITNDGRNIVVSWLRYNNKSITPILSFFLIFLFLFCLGSVERLWPGHKYHSWWISWACLLHKGLVSFLLLQTLDYGCVHSFGNSYLFVFFKNQLVIRIVSKLPGHPIALRPNRTHDLPTQH